MEKTESQILADVYEKVRSLTKMYIKPFLENDKINIYECPVFNGVKFNSAYWLIAHLTWTEHSLILQGVAGNDLHIDWLEEYGFGTNPDEVKTKPPIAEIIKLLDEIHLKATDIIRNLTDKQLEEDNYFGFSIGGSKSKRNIVTHAIRHEPMHAGQLSWILKCNGIKFT